MSLFGQGGGLGTQQSGSLPSFGSQFGAGSNTLGQTASAPNTLPTNTGFGQPQTTSGLFGSAAPAQASGGLFGQTSSNFGGFGAKTGQPGSGGLFGSSTTAPSTGLFGAGVSGPAAPSPGGSGFGLSAATPALGSSFGQTSSGFGGTPSWNQQPNAHQTGPVQAPQAPPGNTRVSQLPPQAIQMLEAVERSLAEQRVKAAGLLARRSATEDTISNLRERYAATRRRLVRTDTGVESLASNAAALRNAVREDRRAADGISHSLTQLTRSLENESGNSGSAYPYQGVAMTPVPSVVMHVNPDYFSSVVRDLEERAGSYKREIDQIAEFLCVESATGHSSGLESLYSRYNAIRSGGFDQARGRVSSKQDGTVRGQESRGRIVEDIIRRQYEYFMVVANNVASVQETITSLKEDFLAGSRRHDPDAVDPFSQADARERADDERKKRAAAGIQAVGLLGGAKKTGPQEGQGLSATPGLPNGNISTGFNPKPTGKPTGSIGQGPTAVASVFGGGASTPSLGAGLGLAQSGFGVLKNP